MISVKQEILLDYPFFRFHYFVPHADSDLRNATPFQGFGEGLVATTEAFRQITHFPTDLRELYATRSQIAFFRSLGKLPYVVYPIQFSSFPEAFQIVPSFLPCILSTGNLTQKVDDFLSNIQKPVLHLAHEASATAVSFGEVNSDTFRQYAGRVAEYLSNIKELQFIAADYRDVMSSKSRCYLKSINLPRVAHNITIPNQEALSSIKLTFSGERLLSPGDPEEYTKAVLKSADFLARERRDALKQHNRSLLMDGLVPQAAVICTAGYYSLRSRDRQDKNNKNSRLVQQIGQMLNVQDGYAVQGEAAVKKIMTPLGMAVATVRSEELTAFTCGLAIKAASHLVSIFRVPQLVADTKWQLIRLAGVVRSAQGQNPKRNRIARSVGQLLRAGLTSGVIERLPTLGNNLKVVSDWPFEWADIGGLPLMLRYNCSRITATPGNLCFSQLIETEELKLPLGSLSEILVVRSFNSSDPIKSTLELALRESNRLNVHSPFQAAIRFVDVNSEEQFIDALNAYSGAIVIFDCHGTYDHSSGVGTLLIGENPLDVWGLRGKVKIPPIVLLSACDTHSLDGSHASVANGMIVLGARTVLGTLLPVDATHSAVFFGRFLLRIQEYIPTYLNTSDTPLRWVSVVSGMQRMHYATEIISLLGRRHKVKMTPDVAELMQFKANSLINPFNPDWFDKLKSEISRALDVPIKVLESIIEMEGQLTEAVRYIQIGNPETIVFMRPSYEEAWSSAENQVPRE